MVHVHLFRSAFASGTREHRLMGMAGETPFANAAELNAEANRVEARLNSDPDDVATQAEFRVTKIRLELTESNAALQAQARAAIDRLVIAERDRRDSRAEVAALETTQNTKRTQLLAGINAPVAPATRATGLADVRTEIDASLTAIRNLSTPPASNRFAAADLIAKHIDHIRKLQDIAPTTALTPLERAQLRSPIALETAATDPSKLRLGRAYLRAEGYEQTAAVPPTLTSTKVYPGGGAPADRTMTINYVWTPGGPPAADKWMVNLTVAGVAIPAMDVVNFTRANVDAAVAANPNAVALINTTTGVARDDIARHLAIGVNMQTGVVAPVPAVLDTVRAKAAEGEQRTAEAELATITTAHTTFLNGPFTTAFLLANTEKTNGTTAGLAPDVLRARIITALDTPATGLRPVAAAQKAALQAKIIAITNPPAGTLRPSNAVAQLTELRRQIADIDAQVRQREVTLGVASAVTAPTTAPAETPEARAFKTAVDAAVNPLSATSTRAQLDTAQTALDAALTTLPVGQRAANQNYIVEKARAKGLTATITGTSVRLEVAPPASAAPAAAPAEDLTARVRPVLELLRLFAPLIQFLNPNFNGGNIDAVLNRMDLQLQLRTAQQELAEFDRRNPTGSLTDALRTQRTAIQTRITDIQNRINALPVISSTVTGSVNRLVDPEAIARFAAAAAARFNAYLAPNTTTIVNNRFIVINCAGKPPDVIVRLNVIINRYGNTRAPSGTPGLPANVNQVNSNVVALDAVALHEAVGGDIERAFRTTDVSNFTPAPTSVVNPVPVNGPVVQANANASINGPKPTYGSSNRRVV